MSLASLLPCLRAHVLQQCLSSALSPSVLQSLGSSAATQPSTSSETALRGPLCDTASMFIPVAPTPCALVACMADELEQELAAQAPGDSGIISAVRCAHTQEAAVFTSCTKYRPAATGTGPDV